MILTFVYSFGSSVVTLLPTIGLGFRPMYCAEVIGISGNVTVTTAGRVLPTFIKYDIQITT